MTLTNHMLAGTVLAKFLPLPVAIPLAFISHFILDSLPHFGFTPEPERKKHPVLSFTMFGVDVVTALALTIWLVSIGNAIWLIPAVVAYSPDLIWIYRFVIEEKFGTLTPKEGGKFIQFHAGIQKFEFMLGWLVEAPVGIGLFLLISN